MKFSQADLAGGGGFVSASGEVKLMGDCSLLCTVAAG